MGAYADIVWLDGLPRRNRSICSQAPAPIYHGQAPDNTPQQLVLINVALCISHSLPQKCNGLTDVIIYRPIALNITVVKLLKGMTAGHGDLR